jgi:hypothetical protein
LAPIEKRFQIEYKAGGLGLSCTAEGVSLAGVPLLRRTIAGLTPRPPDELAVLMKGAYGHDIDATRAYPGLDVIAQALNNGDIGRAMVATIHLRLPDLNEEGAAHIAWADEALNKYDPNEPRDSHGRWATGDGSRPESRSWPAHALGHGRPIANQPARPIRISDAEVTGDARGELICLIASKQCQLTALKDKGRTPYFSACQIGEDTCLHVLRASRLKPDQEIGVIFPDKTVVMIMDGNAIVTRIGGEKLAIPYK